MFKNVKGGQSWRLDPLAFCQHVGVNPESPLGRQILRRNAAQIWQIANLFDDGEDIPIVHVDEFGFTLDGNGINSCMRYEFYRF